MEWVGGQVGGWAMGVEEGACRGLWRVWWA